MYLRRTRYGTLTDSLGYFTLTADLPVGTYTVTIRAIGYKSETRGFSLDTGRTIDLGTIILKTAPIVVEDLTVSWPCTRYRKQPPDSLRRFIRDKGRDEEGRYWDVCKN